MNRRNKKYYRNREWTAADKKADPFLIVGTTIFIFCFIAGGVLAGLSFPNYEKVQQFIEAVNNWKGLPTNYWQSFQGDFFAIGKTVEAKINNDAVDVPAIQSSPDEPVPTDYYKKYYSATINNLFPLNGNTSITFGTTVQFPFTISINDGLNGPQTDLLNGTIVLSRPRTYRMPQCDEVSVTSSVCVNAPCAGKKSGKSCTVQILAESICLTVSTDTINKVRNSVSVVPEQITYGIGCSVSSNYTSTLSGYQSFVTLPGNEGTVFDISSAQSLLVIVRAREDPYVQSLKITGGSNIYDGNKALRISGIALLSFGGFMVIFTILGTVFLIKKFSKQEAMSKTATTTDKPATNATNGDGDNSSNQVSLEISNLIQHKALAK